jgi:hypothetical protein
MTILFPAPPCSQPTPLELETAKIQGTNAAKIFNKLAA